MLSRNAQAGHDIGECGSITGLSGGENERERPTAGVGRTVNFRGQPTAEPSDGVVGRFPGRGPFLRAPAECW